MQSRLIKKLKIMSHKKNIPTVLVFNNGEVVGRQVGVSPKAAYTEAIDALL